MFMKQVVRDVWEIKIVTSNNTKTIMNLPKSNKDLLKFVKSGFIVVKGCPTNFWEDS